MNDKKDNILVRIRQVADNALREMEAGEVDLTKKEIASRAILAYHKVWKARRSNSSRKAIVTE